MARAAVLFLRGAAVEDRSGRCSARSPISLRLKADRRIISQYRRHQALPRIPSPRLKRILLAQVVLTGDPDIDADHARFVGLVDRLCDAVSAGRSKAEILEIYRLIAVDAAEHFRNEESAMARHHYSGLPAHRAAHGRLLADLEKIISAIGSARTKNQMINAANKIQHMLLEHMLKFDVGYKFHLQLQVWHGA
jgi:hemerythrin-like metal-binding protein